jgi:thiol-disulfide isomerase/thioredoxin
MKKLAAALCWTCLWAQAPAAPESEDLALRTALSEAGSSAVDFIRALEQHLERFPETAKRAELERALAKAALEAKDRDRIVRYGERALRRDPDDLQLLERVARALLETDDAAAAERALRYARRYQETVETMRGQEAPGRVPAGEWQEELDRGVARALFLQARASGVLGKPAEATALARSAYETYPSAEAAREIARWLIRQGRELEAVEHLADAFTLADPKNTEADRLRDRQRMGALFSKAKGSEQGLGDLVLRSFDRTSALLEARRRQALEADPNSGAREVLDFTLSGLAGGSLKLREMQGKVVVFDFWATWCGPCRIQHPLYEQVRRKFAGRSEVVFLSVNTDEDRDTVEPFLRENGWQVAVYFEDGLSRALDISSIPTTVILDKQGKVFSRMNGFVPDRFVAMLTERIEDALRRP